MSRDVEVLRWGLALAKGETDPYGPCHPKLNEWQEVLAKTIAALEALERQGVIVATGSALEEKEARQMVPRPREELGGAMLVWDAKSPPKSSSDSMEERLRVVAAGARALALATSDATAKVELDRLAKLAEEGGR